MKSSFLIIKNEFKNNKIHFAICTLFLSIVFAIIITLIEVAISLPSKFEKMINVDARVQVFSTISFDELDFNDYYLVWRDTSEIKLYYDTDEYVNTYLIVVDDELLDDKTIYLSGDSFKDYLDYFENAYLKIDSNDFFGEKSFIDNYNISFVEKEYEAIYVSKGFYLNELENAKMYIVVNIKTYKDVDKAIKFFEKKGLDFEEYDLYGVYSIYKSVKLFQILFVSFSVVLFAFLVVLTIGLMDIYINKRTSFFGILKSCGLSNKRLFNVYYLMISINGFVGVVLGSIISMLLLKYINYYSEKIFDSSFDFKLSFYYPIISYFAFVISFGVYYYINIRKNVTKIDIVKIIKEDIWWII